MTAKPVPHTAPRRPQQERGQRRVDAILDASAALIAEDGIASVTMHRVARRSCTTIGSMYHFFPDRESLLHALIERHVQALRALTARIDTETASQWAQLSTAEAVGRFLDPFLTYTDQHPDLVALARLARAAGRTESRDAELDRLVTGLAMEVIASRSPHASAAELAVRAITMLAMIEGVMAMIGRTAHTGAPAHVAPSADAMRAELRRSLVAYLETFTEPEARRCSSARARSQPSADSPTPPPARESQS